MIIVAVTRLSRSVEALEYLIRVVMKSSRCEGKLAQRPLLAAIILQELCLPGAFKLSWVVT